MTKQASMSLFVGEALTPHPYANLGTDLSSPIRKKLRPHQVAGLDMLRASLGSGNRRVVVQAATGYGKTLLAARIIEGARAKGKRVIFTAPAISLIDQTIAAFEAEGLQHIGAMQASHPRTDASAPIQIASVQTLARRSVPQADMIIVDECHIRSKVIDDLMTSRPDLYFIGLSATPWSKGMAHFWQDMVVPITIEELIDRKYLSEFRVFAPDVPDLSAVQTVAGDYNQPQLADVMEGKNIMANVVRTWLERGENRPTILFGVNCQHAKDLHTGFEEAGVAAAYVDGMTDTIERKLIEKHFRAGEVKVVCSVRTLSTGIDWPVSCIIDAAPTKSIMLHTQKIGRGLRINEGTEDLLVLDHAGNSLRLGLVTDIYRHALDDTEPGKKQKVEQTEKLPKPCVKCECLHVGVICPNCGHEKKPQSGVEAADGELIEMTRGKVKKVAGPSFDEKQKFLAMATWVGRKRGYKQGYAASIYRKKFSVWPHHTLDTRAAIEPDQAFLNYQAHLQIAYAKTQGKN